MFWTISLMSEYESPAIVPSMCFHCESVILESSTISENCLINLRISSRSGTGSSMTVWNRRQTALSSIPAWFVAARSMPSCEKSSMFCRRLFTTRLSSPSSCTSSLAFAIASNSSRNRMHGCFFAYEKMRWMFFAVFPSSDDMSVSNRAVTRGSFNSEARYFAALVFPQPGGP